MSSRRVNNKYIEDLYDELNSYCPTPFPFRITIHNTQHGIIIDVDIYIYLLCQLIQLIKPNTKFFVYYNSK